MGDSVIIGVISKVSSVEGCFFFPVNVDKQWLLSYLYVYRTKIKIIGLVTNVEYIKVTNKSQRVKDLLYSLLISSSLSMKVKMSISVLGVSLGRTWDFTLLMVCQFKFRH